MRAALSLNPRSLARLLVLVGLMILASPARAATPNIVLILADDLGYGDLGCYGATKIPTPNLDRVAREGLRFTDAHTTSATCTPSRFALLTGEYPWRRKGTGILPGNAALIIPTNWMTLPRMLQRAQYRTGVVGKWHLGLGGANGADWNGVIAPGPLEVGFDYCFIMAATGDRVPCVYIEDHHVVGLDPQDPIQVSYNRPIGDDPTGKQHPELLTMGLTAGHDNTIVNGISRIGFMSGGRAARWKDEDMADTFTRQAVRFLERNARRPFFLYFATHDPHVPRRPHPRFAGQSGCGARGDAIVQLDWCVGEVLATLDRLQLATNTLLIFTSDNGPVLDDGYADGAVANLSGHKPAGPLHGGKYSLYEGGTRVPFLVRWPGHVKPGISEALICQVDLLASFAALTKQSLATGQAPDSRDLLPALLGKSSQGRTLLVEHDGFHRLGLRSNLWKFAAPPRRAKGESASELYRLDRDPGETNNLAPVQPTVLRRLAEELEATRQAAPGVED